MPEYLTAHLGDDFQVKEAMVFPSEEVIMENRQAEGQEDLMFQPKSVICYHLGCGR